MKSSNVNSSGAICAEALQSPALLPVGIYAKRDNLEAVLAKTMAYSNLAVVRRLARDLEIHEKEAEPIFKDMLRFLFLCGALEGPFAPSTRIDDSWHVFLLFTEEYQAFCDEMFGAFIHHRPRRDDERDAVGVLPRTIKAAKFFFGELSQNWSYKANADCCSDCPCESCSASTNCQN